MAVDVGASDSRPPLVSGERMDQAEFHRRYSMCPEIKVAELIEGVVHVGGRVTATHGSANAELAFWLGMYSSKVTGPHGGLHTTVILGAHNEFQPDCTLHIDTANGGRT